ncbi:MAG: HEAT repeat domain-containing protein [Planctomycetes bacterium]|nr:HEAT repeat domain-containing protein [Planctomycetota bacterium]
MRMPTILILLSMLLQAGCIEKRSFEKPVSVASQKVDIRRLKSRALKIVGEAITDESGVMRSHAIEVIVTTKRRELMPQVLKLLADEQVHVRFGAGVAVGDMEYIAGEYMVKPMLEDPNPNARIAAAYAMVRLGKAEYAEKIRDAAKSTDQTVRANAALLLGKLGDKDNLPVLYEVLRDLDSRDKARFQAVESIARLGDEQIYRDKLWALLISKYADDRVLGIQGMGLLNTVDAKNAIITMLNDEVGEVRLCAAEQLAKMGDLSGEQEVLAYFKTQSPDLNQASIANIFATMAIGRMASSGTRYLPQLLQSRSKVIRLTAAQSVLVLVLADAEI